MRYETKRRRKGLRLAVVLTALALLCFFGWLAEGCPKLTKAGAFRQSLRNAAMPEAGMDAVLRRKMSNGGYVALGSGVDGAVAVRLWDAQPGWTGDSNPKWYPAADGVRYVLLNQICYALTGSNPDIDHFPRELANTAAVAVKTDGARAELRLVLEPVTFGDIDESWTLSNPGAVGVTWPLRELETQGDWTVFGFDGDAFPEGISGKYRSLDYFPDARIQPYEGYEKEWDALYWIQNYYNRSAGLDRVDVQPSRFELTLYDEDGNVAGTAVLDPTAPGVP